MKKICIAVLFICMLCIPVMTASANAPAPPSYFYCEVQNAPSDAVYMDILIEISSLNNEYVSFNSQNEASGITTDAPIVAYNEDGYMSLSFHYDGMTAYMGIDSPYFTAKNYNQSIDKISKTIKVALLDKDGNIINISEAIDTAPPTSDEFAYSLIYDADHPIPTLGYSHFYKGYGPSAGFTLPLFFALVLRMLISTGTETLIAVPFKIKPLWKIIAVNLVTQILLILFMSASFIDLTYSPSLIVAEIFVYTAELIAYFVMFKNVPKWEIAVYTIGANTVTLVIGLWMNAVHILV